MPRPKLPPPPKRPRKLPLRGRMREDLHARVDQLIERYAKSGQEISRTDAYEIVFDEGLKALGF